MKHWADKIGPVWKTFNRRVNRTVVRRTAGIAVVIGLLLTLGPPIAVFAPHLSVALGWGWFLLPGLVLASVLYQRLSWWERIPIAFALALGIHTPYTILAILLRTTLNHLLLLSVATFFLIFLITESIKAKVQPHQNNLEEACPEFVSQKFEPGLLFYLAILIIFVGSLVYLSSVWPVDGDDLSGLPYLEEALGFNRISGTEPFHGSGTPSTPRNELIVWAYQGVLVNKLAGVTPEQFVVYSRSIFILVSILAMYLLLHQYLRDRRQALFMLTLWSIYLLASNRATGPQGATRIEGAGNDLVMRIFQDDFLGWFTVVPVILVFLLWFLEKPEARYLVSFGLATFGTALLHPVPLTQMMILGGGFGLIYLFFVHSWQALRHLVIIALVLSFCLVIPVIQYFRFMGQMPIEIAGLGDALEYGKMFMAAARYRLFFLQGGNYILHPAIFLQPIIIIGYVLLPLLCLQISKNNFARLVAASMVSLPLIFFFPPLAKLAGKFVTPNLLWRLSWPIQTLALLTSSWALWFILNRIIDQGKKTYPSMGARRFLFVPGVVILAVIFSLPSIQKGYIDFRERQETSQFTICTRSKEAVAYLDRLTNQQPQNVLASTTLNFCIPAYAAFANVVEYRGFGTINRLPAGEINDSLQRVTDSLDFSGLSFIDSSVLDTIERWNIQYIFVERDRLDLYLNLRHLPALFTQLYTDQDYAIFSVHWPIQPSPIIEGNTALRKRQWDAAEDIFNQIILEDQNQVLAYVGLGLVHENLGDLDRAVDYYQKAGSVADDEPAIHTGLAHLYLLLREPGMASMEFRRATNLEPNRASLYYSLGISDLLSGNEYQALKSIERAASLQTRAGSASYYSLVGDFLASVNRPDRAEEYYQKALALASDPDFHVGLAKARAQSGDVPGAIQQFQQAIRAERWHYLPHLGLGSIYQSQGDLDKAVQEYETAIRLNPTNVSPFVLLGGAIEESSGADAAIIRLESLFSLNRLLPGPHRGLVSLYIQKGQTGSALQELDLAEKLQPLDPSISSTTGFIWIAEDRFDRALDAFDHALLINPDLLSAHTGLSVVFAKNNQPDQQLGSLLKVVSMAPVASWPHLSLANIYLDQGMWENAQKEAEWAILLDPDRAPAYVTLGNIHQSRANWDLGLAAYVKALELEPDNTKALVQSGLAYQAMGDFSKSQALFERAIQANSEEIGGYIKLAQLYWEQGRLDEAAGTLETAASIEPVSDLVLLPLANIYLMQGRIDEARLVYQRSVQDNPALLGAYASWAQLELEQYDNPWAAFNLYYGAIELNPKLNAVHIEPSTTILLPESMHLDLETPSSKSISWPKANLYLGLSQIQQRSGEWDQALEILQIGTDALPGEARVIYNLALFYLQRGEYEKAREKFWQTIEVNPNFASAYVGLSRLHGMVGDTKAEQDLLQEALKNNPGSAEIFLAFSNYYQAQGDSHKAESCLQDASRAMPANAQIYRGLGIFYRTQGRYEESIESFQRALSLPVPTPDLYLELGETYRQLGSIREAFSWYQEAMVRDKLNPAPYLATARLYQQQRNWDEALKALTTAIQLEPTSADAHQELGNLYQKLNLIEKAKEQFEMACQLDHSYSGCRVSLGKLLLKERKPEQAIGYLYQAIEASPTNLENYTTLAEIYRIRNQKSSARLILTQGLNKSVDKVGAQLARGDFFATTGEWEEARADYEAAWSTYPNSLEAGLRLALYYKQRGEWKQALDVLETIEESPIVSSQVFLEKGKIYSGRANWEQAIDAYRNAIQIDPQNPNAYAGLAQVCEELGEMDKALEFHQAAVSASPEDPIANINLGDAYQARLNYTAAQAAYEKALSLDPESTLALIGLDDLSRRRGETGIDLSSLIDRANVTPTVNLSILLGERYQSRGDWETALYWLNRAVELDPYSDLAWFSLGNYYSKLNQWQQAGEAFTTALSYRPDSPNILLSIGEVQFQLNRMNESMDTYNRVIEIDPGRIEAYIALANLHLGGGHGELAENMLKEGIARAPSSHMGYQALGMVYSDQGKPALALKEYMDGLALIPGSAELYLRLGDIYSGNVKAAEQELAEVMSAYYSAEFRFEQFKKLLTYTRRQILQERGQAVEQIFSNSRRRRILQDRVLAAEQVAKSAKYKLIQAELAFNEKQADLETARSAYLKALSLQPGNEAGWIALGRLSSMFESPVKALPYFEEARKVNPTSALALNYLAITYLELGETDQAITTFQDAVRYEPGNIFSRTGLFSSYKSLNRLTVVQSALATANSQPFWPGIINSMRLGKTR